MGTPPSIRKSDAKPKTSPRTAFPQIIGQPALTSLDELRLPPRLRQSLRCTTIWLVMISLARRDGPVNLVYHRETPRSGTFVQA